VSKFIAIDLDTRGVYIVGGTARSAGVKVEHALTWAGTEAEGSPPVFSPETAASFGEQLRDRLRAAGIPPAPVLVSVPRDRVVLKEVRYPVVPPTEEPALVRFQAMKELSDSPDDILLDYVPLQSGSTAAERLSLVVVLRKDLYAAIRTLCESAELKLLAVTPRPYAIAAGLALAFASGAAPAPEATGEAVAVLSVGPTGGEFTIVRNGEVVFTKSVLAPVLASEGMLLAEVRRNLAMYAGANPGHPAQALYVAEADDAWAGRLRTALSLPVHAYDPLFGSSAVVPEAARSRFAGAAGLLAAAAGELPINFASPRQPRREADPRRWQLAFAALAGLLLFGACAAFGWWKLDAADRRIAQLTEERDARKMQLEALEPDAKRLAAADAWKARKVNWLDELFDLADRFTAASGEMYASSISAKAIPPNPKTGKQDHQATLDVRVWAKTPDPVNSLLAAIDRDAVDPAPKDPRNPSRFYVGVDKLIGGTTQGEAGMKEFTVFAKVNGRPAEKYTRAPSFSPPSRKGYPPAVAPPRAKEPEADRSEAEPDDPEDRKAPPPREK